MASNLSSGEQSFTFPIFHQQMDDTWEFGIRIPPNPLISGTDANFTKTINIDVIGKYPYKIKGEIHVQRGDKNIKKVITNHKILKYKHQGVSVTQGQGSLGERRTLECKVEGAIESPNFLWTVNNMALINTDDTEGNFDATSGSKTSSLELMVGGGKVNSDVECECIVEAFSDKFTLPTYFDVFSKCCQFLNSCLFIKSVLTTVLPKIP